MKKLLSILFFVLVSFTVSAQLNADAGNDVFGKDEFNRGYGSVTLNGTHSTPADGDTIVSYIWTDIDNNNDTVQAVAYYSSIALDVGVHTIVLTVTDNHGATDTDTTIATIYSYAEVPKPDAGARIVVTDSDNSRDESVTLDGTGSTDNGTITDYTWYRYDDTHVIATGATPTVTLPVGTYKIYLRVTDNLDIEMEDYVFVEVRSSVQHVYYVQDPSDNSNASDSNAGTNINYPWATWGHAFTTAQAGDTVYFRGGTYYLTSSINYIPYNGTGYNGNYSQPIVFMAYPGEVPIADYSNYSTTYGSTSMLNMVDVNYVEYKDLVWQYLKQNPAVEDQWLNGFAFSWGQNILVEHCTVRHTMGAGFRFYGFDTIRVYNCDAYDNIDSITLAPRTAGHADGFIVSSKGNAFDTLKVAYLHGNRAWFNSDDGYDIGASKQLYIDSCWSWNNGRGLKGDGNGFKFAIATVPRIQRIIRNCITAYSIKDTVNNQEDVGAYTNVNLYDSEYSSRMTHLNNVSYHDYTGYKSSDSYCSCTEHPDAADEYIANCIVYNPTSNNYGDFNICDYGQGNPSYVDIDSCNFQMRNDPYGRTEANPTYTLTDDDFVSLDTAELRYPRKSDGSLPDINFMKLKAGSDLIDGGIDVGLAYTGAAPDLGWAEYDNLLPIANAGSDQFVNDTNNSGDASVQLNGALSRDDDGSLVSDIWTEGTDTIASGHRPVVTLTVGVHTIVLTETDNDGATDTDTTVVTVVGYNEFPRADAGSTIYVIDNNDTHEQNVVLDGSGSYDPDGTIVSYEWKLGGKIALSSQEIDTVSVRVGKYYATLTVVDNDGYTTTDEVEITVEPTSYKVLYVQDPAYNSNADDNNTGTDINYPLATWQQAVRNAMPGDTVYLRGGTYYPDKGIQCFPYSTYYKDNYHNGTYKNHIVFKNYKDEIPIIDARNFTATTSASITTFTGVTYMEFEGITLQHIYQLVESHDLNGFGINEFGTVWLRNMTVRHTMGAGFRINDYDTIYVYNCDAYDNIDSLTVGGPGTGGHADGYTISSRGLGTDTFKVLVMDGCRAWNNSDDNIDIATSKQIYISNCWAWGGGRMQGDGTGFKVLYSCNPINQRTIRNCIAAYNSSKRYEGSGGGYRTVNLHDLYFGPVAQYINCVAYKNSTGFGTTNCDADREAHPDNFNELYQNCISYQSTNYTAFFRADDWSQGNPSYATIDSCTFAFNGNIHGQCSDDVRYTVTDDDFLSLDTAQLAAPRKADHSLPDITFMKLAPGSDLIDRGVVTNIGLPYSGKAPDLGWAEYEQIIADHTVVSKFDDIPDNWIDSVKQMIWDMAGESHSKTYANGMLALEALDSKYDVNYTNTGTPEAETDQHLRVERVIWGDVDHTTGWIWNNCGQEDWFETSAAVSQIKTSLSYMNSQNVAPDVFGFGWCWDQTYTSAYPYLDATQQYVDYCAANSIPTHVSFTTGPVDTYDAQATEAAYLKSVQYDSIRWYVRQNNSRILFDFADILCYDEGSETPNTQTWNGHTFPIITDNNLNPQGDAHISAAGELRLAKAAWWMLARLAGWNGGASTPEPPVNHGDSIIITSDLMLADSLVHNRVPGDTLYLKYDPSDTHTFSLSGTLSHPIVIRSHPNHRASFKQYQVITGKNLIFDGINFDRDTYLNGDSIELKNDSIRYEGLIITGKDINIHDNIFNVCDTAVYLNGTEKPKIINNIFNANSETVYSIVFPNTDWRGYYFEIDNNTYNVTPSTIFDGETWSGWRAKYYNWDTNSSFNITGQ